MEEMLRQQEWTGFYIESYRGKGWMNMRLVFRDGTISGEGVDYVGTWHLEGFYSLENLSCSWIKKYLGKHDVHYEGRLSETGIMGHWSIGPEWSDRFHIWPVSMTHIQQEYLAQENQLPESQSPESPSFKNPYSIEPDSNSNPFSD